MRGLCIEITRLTWWRKSSSTPLIHPSDFKTWYNTQTRQIRIPKKIEFPVSIREKVDEFEVSILRAALEKAKFNQRKTAELLGLTYNQVRNSVRKHNISTSEPDVKGKKS